MFIAYQSFAQTTPTSDEVTKKNSWLKAGISLAAPVGDVSNYSSFAGGIELSGQFMRTNHFGIGIATGYTKFFGKNGSDGLGTIPLGLMLRYYPMYKGFFAGTDIGYTFYTNSGGPSGGFYLRPQLGYHNYDWNLFAFFNQIFGTANNIDVQSIGVAATYNIRFK